MAVRLADGGASPARPGRSCPPHYGYSPRVLARAADLAADAVYVVGGLYGNALALDAIERMAGAEPQAPTLVFNGDFHWFDAEPELYAGIQGRVMAVAAGHVVLRGNVETEIASAGSAAGCGCAYPESVPDDDVERSNAIMARLRAVAAQLDMALGLAALPMHRVLAVNGLRVAVVHGDAWALAGWHFAHDAVHAPENAARLAGAFELAAVDVFACSHTCAPALALAPTARGEGFIVNNGAAGMANFAGTTFGVITRIAGRALPRRLEGARLYGANAAGTWIDALRVDFDVARWLARFDRIWPSGSAAAASYRDRIAHGPAFSIDAALGRQTAACAA